MPRRGLMLVIFLLTSVGMQTQYPYYQAQPVGKGTISGMVRDASDRLAHTGQGIATEVAVSVEVQRDGKWNRFGGAAHIDTEGRFRIEGLPDGKYIVFAAFPGSIVRSNGGLISGGGPFLFAPGTPRPSKASVFQIHNGGSVDGVMIVAPQDSGHIVTGQVFDSAQKPVVRGLVRMYASGEAGLSRAVPVAANGSFTFDDVTDEEYTVFATESGVMFPDSTSAVTTVRVQRGSDPKPLTLTLPQH